jgi:hypothetical protein
MGRRLKTVHAQEDDKDERTGRFTAEGISEIEEWRRLQPTIPSRTDAIRALVSKGLEAYRREAAAKSEKAKGRK